MYSHNLASPTLYSHKCATTSPSLRPSALPDPPTPQVDLDLSEVSLVVCNDRPNSFGAPDVLQASAGGMVVRYHCDQPLPDHPAEYGARLQLAASVNFLNNSSSRCVHACQLDLWHAVVSFPDGLVYSGCAEPDVAAALCSCSCLPGHMLAGSMLAGSMLPGSMLPGNMLPRAVDEGIGPHLWCPGTWLL
jgi:hypothetical protein